MKNSKIPVLIFQVLRNFFKRFLYVLLILISITAVYTSLPRVCTRKVLMAQNFLNPASCLKR